MDQIGKYKLEAEIGRGGFGRVYRALDPAMGRAVAIKVLVSGGDKEILTRFRKEANATGKLRHRNIITVHDYGEHQGTPYLVMEHLEGSDLHRILASGSRPGVPEAVSIMAQVADGLLHAHQNGIVHRDVKPANIMVLNDGSVKIMDFGIARVLRDCGTRLTQRGNLVGTVSYMAPEHFQDAEIDERCDIFSYGVIYYELLTGQNPFNAPDPWKIIHNITSLHPPPVRELLPECPPALDQIVSRALKKERELRYQSFDDLQFDATPIRLRLQHAQAERLVAEAARLLKEGQAGPASQIIRQVLDLDPNNAAARELRETIQRETQSRLLRERSAQRLARGKEELASHQYSKAVHTLESALRIDPENTEIARLADEARSALQRSQRAASLLATARRELEARNLTSAYRNVLECLEQVPDNKDAASLLASIRKAIDAREKERRLKEGLAQVESLAAAESYDEALAVLSDLEANYPHAQNVKELLARIHFAREEQARARRLAGGLELARAMMQEQKWQE
ncbi:MAG: protein kinase domain-containing protein, partial [Bryobacteraceae bacterium]